MQLRATVVKKRCASRLVTKAKIVYGRYSNDTVLKDVLLLLVICYKIIKINRHFAFHRCV